VRDTYRAQKEDFLDKDDRRRQFTVQVSHSDDFSLEVASQKLRDFYSGRGIKKIEILHQQPWKYFYHFGAKEIAEEYPWKILELDGKHHTAFVHACGAFETVNDTISYATMVTDFLYTCCSQ